MPSKKLWAYIARLEKVIKQTMESSEEISELVEKIQREGVEVSLNCIALFSDHEGRSFTGPDADRAARAAAEAMAAGKAAQKKGKKPAARKKQTAAGKPAGAKADLHVTDADREFLRQIGIRFD